MDKLTEIKEALVAATPGPWFWHGYLKHSDIDLVSEASGHPTVMGFRRWGMQGAAPSFNKGGAMERIDEPGMVTTRKPHTSEFYQVNHPDAFLIAHAPEYITYLLQLVETQQGQFEQINECIDEAINDGDEIGWNFALNDIKYLINSTQV